MKIVGACAAATLLALMLVACATVAPRNPPHIDIVAVSLDHVEGPDAYFTVVANLSNPASEDIVIDALEGRLGIEGEDIAQAALAGAPVRVPANGTATAELAAHTGMDAVLRAVAAAMRRGAT